MRVILAISFLVCVFQFKAQHHYFGDLQTLYLFENQVYRSDNNLHTAIKPYNFRIVKKNNFTESVFQKGVW